MVVLGFDSLWEYSCLNPMNKNKGNSLASLLDQTQNDECGYDMWIGIGDRTPIHSLTWSALPTVLWLELANLETVCVIFHWQLESRITILNCNLPIKSRLAVYSQPCLLFRPLCVFVQNKVLQFCSKKISDKFFIKMA